MASWQETYEQLKKRKKQIDAGQSTSNKKQTMEYRPSRDGLPTINTLPNTNFNSKPTLLSDNFLMPDLTSKTTRSLSEKEKEDLIKQTKSIVDGVGSSATPKDEKWYEKIFTKGEFADGVDGVGDFFLKTSKTILGTATDVSQNFGEGLLTVAEAPLDVGTNILASGFNLFGNEEAAEKIRDFANVNLSKTMSERMANNNATGILYNAINGDFEKIINPAGIEWDKDKSLAENYTSNFEKAWLDESRKEKYEESSVSGQYADEVTKLVGYTLGLMYGGGALSKGKAAKVGTTKYGLSANAGNIGITLGGRTLNVPTLAIAGGMSSGLQEANSKEDVTELERWTKGISSGLIEGITEGMFGFFGKSGMGGITNEAGEEIFDKFGRKFAEKFSSRAAKILANVGIKSLGEPAEELASYTLNYFVDNNIIDKMGDADFSKTWDWGEVGEQMALAYASSLITQGGGNVINNNKAIAEAEKQLGRKLTPQEKAEVTQASIDGTLQEKAAELEKKFNVQTESNDTIQNTQETVEDIDNQIAVLEEQLMATESEAEYERLSKQIQELENRAEQLEQQEIAPVQMASTEQISQPTTQEVETNLATDVVSNTQNIETNPKRRNFAYDTQKVTDEYSKSTYESASKFMNDTERSHKFVDVVAKISTEKKTKYEFTNNEDIKNRGYDIKGKQVNGLVTVEENGETKILINIDSPKALNTIVGHETTHLLEGTQEYKDLQEAIFEYAKTKGEFNDRKAKLHSLYKNIKGANVNNELTADLVGDYLFTDSKFIESLSIEKPTLFQKLKNLIDDLVVKFKGTKEEKQLREVQKKFREAYRQATSKTKTQYSIENIASFDQKEYNSIKEMQIENKEYGRLIHIIDSYPNIKAGINHVILNDKTYEIYYKDYNEFKVMDVFDTVSAYSEVENDGVTENASERIEGTGSNSRNSQFSNVEVENSNSTGKNVELSDNNKGQDGKQKQNNIESDRNKGQELEDSSFFNAKYSLSDIPLEERVSGDELLDAQDLIEDIKSVNGEVDDNGYVTVYHQTTTENANKILETGKMTAKEFGVFFSTSKKAQQSEGKGTTKLEFKIPAEKLLIDDIFDDNIDVKIPLNRPGEYIDVSDYLVKNKGNTQYENVIRYSLSNPEEQIAPTGDYNVYGKDVKLEEAIAPLQEEIQTLTATVKELKKQIAPMEESKALTEADLPYIEQLSKEATNQDIAPVRNNLTAEESQELDMLEDIPFDLSADEQARMEELQNKERNSPEENEVIKAIDPFEDRNYETVGNKKVKAYQYEHPEVKPFFREMAHAMLGDLNNSQKGKRYVIGDISQTGNGNYEFSGQKRHTTEDIAYLLDSGYTYADIEKGLNAIIKDEGAENIAVAKRIEFALNDRLLHGYTDITGYEIPPNKNYINLLRGKEYTSYYDSLQPSDIAPYEETSEEVSNTDIAPVLKVSPKAKTKTTNKNVDWEALEDTSKGVQQQFNAETNQIEDTVEKKTKKQIKQELLQKTGIMNESLDNANKIPKMLMENTDPIRLQELIFGRKLGTKVNEMFFQKVKDNTSEKIRFQNKERAEIKDLGIKARSKESAAVQKYGEKQYVNDNGEVIPYGDKELASEFPNVETQKKIKKAAEIIRQKYDSYLDTTNKVLTNLGYDAIPKRKDYMRHFQELNDIFSRVGIPYNYNEMTANDLPTDINGLTADFSPSKNFFASTLQRKGVKTTYDAITGIDGYLEGIGNLIYHTEDIQRLRAYEQYIRDTYGENHGFDNLENLTDEEKAIRIEKIQDNHLSNYASWLHEYTNTLAGKKAMIDRSVESLTGRRIYSFLNTTKSQVGKNMIGFNLSSAMTNAIAEVQALAKTNKLATIKGLGDTVKNIFVKDGFVEKNNFLTSRFGSDMLSKNLWQKAGDAGFVFMQGTDNFISQLVVRSKYNELKTKGYTDQQAHDEAGKFAARLMGDRSQGATANIYNSQMLGLVTQFQLEVNNQLYSMFYDTYQESKEQAKGKALKTAAGMTYTLGQLAVFTHLFGAGFEAMAGYNPTFDIIGMLMTAFGLDDDEEDEDTTTENLGQAFEKLLDALPYVNILTGGGRVPVSEALPLEELFTGKDEFGNDKSRVETLKEALPYYVLPSGYGQIKKTTKGLAMYDEDLPIAGSYTDSGNLRFTAKDDTLSKIQAAIFGQWANDEAQAYVDSEFKTINKSNVDELIDLGMTSSEYRKYKTGLSAQKSVEDKIEYINNLNVTDEQKSIMANNVLKRDYNVDMGEYDDFGSYEEFDFSYKNPEKYEWFKENGISYEDYSYNKDTKELYNYAYNNPEKYKTGKAITGDFEKYMEYRDYIYDLKADKDSNGDSITGTRKTKVISYVNSLDLSIPQKAMLIREEYSSFNDYNYDIVEYVDNLDIDYEEKVLILESLDMEIDDEGNISW